jgi:hypothetical protein
MDSIGIKVQQLGQRILARDICCCNSKQLSPFREHGHDQEYPAVSPDLVQKLFGLEHTETMAREALELVGLQRK